MTACTLELAVRSILLVRSQVALGPQGLVGTGHAGTGHVVIRPANTARVQYEGALLKSVTQ